MRKLAIVGGDPIRSKFLVYGCPDHGSGELEAVKKVIESGWWSTGKETLSFEGEIKAYVGSEYAVAANSCTALLHLSLLVNGISQGDEVITTPMTFCATTNVIEHIGAKVVLADTVEGGFHIDVNDIERKISPKTKAIMPVHFAGYPANIEAINNLAKKYSLAVIEDAAHALGASLSGRKIGNSNNSVVFSLYVTKNVAAGEGGVLTTNNSTHIDRIRSLGLHGMSRGAWARYTKSGDLHYDILEPGFKYNMQDINAALARVQLAKVDEFTRIRTELAHRYFSELADVEAIDLPSSLLNRDGQEVCTWHIFPIRINLGILTCDRDDFMRAMIAENIGVATHYRPIYAYTYYRNKYNYDSSQFPHASAMENNLFSIPLNTSMSYGDQDDVIRALRDVVAHYTI